MKGFSMFAGAGIGEYYLNKVGIEIIAANELISKRADLYKSIYPHSKMICGDIRNPDIFNQLMESAFGCEFMIASPPCQGFSIAGKNRNNEEMQADSRNYLINWVLEAARIISPKFILIENVPNLLKYHMPYKGKNSNIVEILYKEFGDKYNIDAKIVDASDYGVPQIRMRAIIKIYDKNYSWPWPDIVKKKITVKDAIGNLPSLESGQQSNIKWHFARKHLERQVEWMKHTPSGESAFSNKFYYPKKVNGERIKGYESSYRRIKWDEPAPTITIRNDAISSQRNVHPGRLLSDGTYSDARVLTPLELMLLSSLPYDWNIPDNTPELLIRQCIGEAIPPLMIEKIVGEIKCK